MIVSIEGLIGIGKSTLIEHLKNNLKEINGKPLVFLKEPIEEWQGLIELFYKDQKRYAFSFQLTVLVTMARLLKKTIKDNPDSIIICERSVFSSRDVFVKMLYDNKMISDIDYQLYLMLFDEITKDIPLSGVIYLKATPSTCLESIKTRNRSGEEGMQLDYLEKCQEFHDEFFKNNCMHNCRRLKMSGECLGCVSEKVEIIKDFLESK